MRKLVLTIFALVISGYWVFSQDDEPVIEKSHGIHVAYSPSTSAVIGFHVGLISNSEGIFGGEGVVESGGLYLSGRYNNRNILNLDRLSVDLGVSLQLVKLAHLFIGGGYGEYKYPYKEPTILPDKEIKGFELEGGTIISLGKITLHAGVSTLKFEHLDVFGGIGYVF